jgi:hypothetical protein
LGCFKFAGLVPGANSWQQARMYSVIKGYPKIIQGKMTLKYELEGSEMILS